MKKISHIIFDVDGTLYEPVDELSQELHEYWVKQIMYHLHVNYDEAEKEFSELKKEHVSSTLSLSAIGLGSPRDVIKQAERHMRSYFKKYILKDRKLIKLLKKLKLHYTLATLRNGTRAGTRFILSLIGFSARRDERDNGYGPFDYIFPTVELGPTKPDPLPFKNILKKLAIDPSEILVIGDRADVDLKVAKDFGMRTALVTWGKKVTYNKKDVDVTMETIYDIEQLII